MKNKIVLILLFLIVSFAAFLRFYSISNVPVSLYWDEAAIGYNAYSISQTGKDEYGTFMPILFRSFDDYKTSGNIYLTSLSVLLFGLSEFAVRFPSALFGTLTVLIFYFLIVELFSYAPQVITIGKREIPINSRVLSLISTFMLAISPWHIQFSRSGFEANIALFFQVLGIYALLLSLRKDRFNFFISIPLIAFSFYIYRSIWLTMPLFLLSFISIFKYDLLRKIYLNKIIIGLVLFMVLLIPLFYTVFSGGGLTRGNQVSIFSNVTNFDSYAHSISQSSSNVVSKKLFSNTYSIKIMEFALNYYSNFSPDFLFFNGDGNPRQGPRDMGLLYVWEIPFFLLGILGTFFLPRKIKYFIITWILIAPIPAALSIPNPHALRSLFAIPMLTFFTGFGIYIVSRWIKKRSFQASFAVLLTEFIIYFFVRYLSLYYVIGPQTTSSAWADGYKQLVSYTTTHKANYNKIIISGHYWQPYIYFLFYTKYNPVLYQKYGTKRGFDKYLFGGTSWDQNEYSQELGNINLRKFAHADKVLVALSPQEYATQANNIQKLTEIRDHDNNLVFIVGNLK